MSPFSSVHTFKNLRVFTVICGKEILRPFSKCDVRCWEHMSSFGKVHSASSPPHLPCFLYNDMQEPGFTLGTHVLWICYISFMLFVVKSSKHFCVWDGLCSLFFISLLACDCVRVRWGVSVIFISPALWLLFPSSSSSSSTLSLSVFYFSTCN